MSERLRQWEREGARGWVEAQRGHWDHVAWLKLLGELRRAGWADLDPEAVGAVLERRKAEFLNLRRWRDSGEAWRWVEARRGRWEHFEFMTLLAGLNCWMGPIDPDALGEALDELRGLYHRLRLWIATGAALRWVEDRQGHWDHGQWLTFLARVKEDGFGDLPAHLVGLALEEAKRDYWNLRRWEESGEPYRWVEARRGRWSHADWERLLASLERSPFAASAEAVAAALERARQRYENLRRWRQSGEPLLWVGERGTWDHADWIDLLARVESAEGPVEPAALGELLEATREQYANLQRLLDRRCALQERLTLEEVVEYVPPPQRLAA